MQTSPLFPSLIAAVFFSLSPAWCEIFTDNFDRENSEIFSSDAAASMGTGYVLSQTGKTGTPTAAVQSGQAWIARADNTHTGNSVLRYEGLPLRNSEGSSFQLEVDVTTPSITANALFYGPVFHYQTSGSGAGSFYAARLCNAGNVELQILKISPAGVASNVVNVKNSTGLKLSTTYHITITSSSPGHFEYVLTGPGLDGGSLTGNYQDASPLTGGFAGLYTSLAIASPKPTETHTPKFDNFSLAVKP